MRTEAWELHQTGAAQRAFRSTEIRLPPLQENELLIAVEAFGLNWSDIMLRRGTYNDKPRLPCVLGWEVVGKVIAAGSSAHETLLGKRVLALTCLGGYARHAIARVDAAAPIGDAIDANSALALALQGVTAYYMACHIAPLRAADWVLIHAAAGGVGSLLLQLAKNAGARVIAKVGSDSKKALCLRWGADYAINYQTENYAQAARKILGTQTLDAVYNCVGGSTFRQDKKLLGAGARLFLYGGAQLTRMKYGALSQLNFLRQMGGVLPVFWAMQSASLIGVNMLRLLDARPDTVRYCLHAVIALHAAGQIRPQTAAPFPHTELAHAHEVLESGQSSGKIAVFHA